MSKQDAIMKCHVCTEYCPQEELACEIAKGRMWATQALVRYEQIGTVEEFKELKEKSIAKKPTLVTRGFVKFYPCPYCSTPEKYIQVYPKQKHCVECGQKLNWEE